MCLLNTGAVGYQCYKCGTFVPIGTMHWCENNETAFYVFYNPPPTCTIFCPWATSCKKAILPSCYEKKE